MNFQHFLIMMLNISVQNAWTIPSSVQFDDAMLKTFGNQNSSPYLEFHEWFSCKREQCVERLNRVEARYKKREITISERDELSMTWCYVPVWRIKEEMKNKAYKKVNAVLEGVHQD